MARRVAVLVLALMLAPLATVGAQTAPAAPTAPVAPSAASGNPSNPADFARNPHPDMLWFGIATPYGQFLRWMWVAPTPLDAEGALVQPGFWVAETTTGFYVPDRWAIAQGPAGEVLWRMVPRAFLPR
jgi:hypothetical protein